MSRRGSIEQVLQNLVQNFSVALNALKYLKLTTRYAERKMLKLQSFLGSVLVHNYCKTKVQEEQSIVKEQILSV